MASKVMVVDDTDNVRQMLVTMLSLDGFEVVAEASGGREAIDAVASAKPNVVVMDYKMPQMDGIEATRKIREIAPDVGVILYTAYLDDELERQAREAGAGLRFGAGAGVGGLGHR